MKKHDARSQPSEWKKNLRLRAANTPVNPFLPEGGLKSISPMKINVERKKKELKRVPDKCMSVQTLKWLDRPASTTDIINIGSLFELDKAIRAKMLRVNLQNVNLVDEAIRKMPWLLELHAVDLRLKSLPSKVGELLSLEKLDLSKNSLVTLPSEICQLKKLRELNLGHNNLCELPEGIGALKQLAGLHIEHNKLCELPVSITDLTRLKQLYVHGNLLGDLLPQEGLNRMTGLTRLSFDAQHMMDSLPRFATLVHNGNLTRLYVDASHVTFYRQALTIYEVSDTKRLL